MLIWGSCTKPLFSRPSLITQRKMYKTRRTLYKMTKCAQIKSDPPKWRIWAFISCTLLNTRHCKFIGGCSLTSKTQFQKGLFLIPVLVELQTHEKGLKTSPTLPGTNNMYYNINIHSRNFSQKGDVKIKICITIHTCRRSTFVCA